MSTLRLANHVEAIHFRGQDPSKQLHRPFKNGQTKIPPTLRRCGVNRILVFPGSFNPLHQGHVDLLRHAFENAGDDLYIIAAIIIMTDDERLRMKMRDKEDPLAFSREQRVNLWRGVDSILDWAWVYDKPEADWTVFRTELTSRLKKNGLELKFSLLGGPDHISTQGLPDLQVWGCADAITSDVSRPVDFRYPNSLRQLSGCTMWERPNIDRGKLEREIRTKLYGKSEQGKRRE